MYSPFVIEKNRQRASRLIAERHSVPKGWELKPSTEQEVAEMKAHFDKLLDEKGRLRRELTREEELWRLAEKTMCKIDFRYFGLRYAKIENEESRVVYFEPRLAQQIVLEMMGDMEERGYALMFIFLKARQLGITVLWQLLIAHRTLFYRNVNTLTGSAVEAKSRKMFQKFEFLYDRLPWWLRPHTTASRAGESMEFDELNSGIYVQWGNQKSGIGRGDTPSVSHLSEVASFENPAELIDSSLVRAQHENPFSLMGFEGTAEQMGDWFHRTWDFNVKMDTQGLARLKPIFLPWFVGQELYPKKAFLKRRPIPKEWEVPEHIERHALACETYVASTPYLEKALGEGWRMPLKQKWFYYLDYMEHREKNELHLFLREMPARPSEAFQNANPSVFSIETLAEVRDRADSSRPDGVFQLVGPSISPIYTGARSIGEPMVFKAGSETFALEPLRLEGWPEGDPEGRLYIWEWPLAGEEYGVYCDPAEGAEQDNSVVGVIKRATPWHPDEQVAEWASNRVVPHDLWAFVWAIANLWSVQGPDGIRRTPRTVIEVNIAAGDAIQTEMAKRGWTNFHQPFDMTVTGMVGGAGRQKPRGLADRIGWRTDRRSRPKMISLFRKAVRDGTFVVRSPWLVREMATLEYNLDRQRIEATQGSHDDRIVGPAMLLTSWYDPEVYGNVPTAWRALRERERELEEMPRYLGDTLIGQRARQFGTKVEGEWAKVDSRGMGYD